VSEPDLRQVILDLLDQRGPGKTICPSDAARVAAGDDSWRRLMDPVRAAAQTLVDDGQVEITQKGARVDLATVRGPVRIRRV
jgi:hypothetical protein